MNKITTFILAFVITIFSGCTAKYGDQFKSIEESSNGKTKLYIYRPDGAFAHGQRSKVRVTKFGDTNDTMVNFLSNGSYLETEIDNGNYTVWSYLTFESGGRTSVDLKAKGGVKCVKQEIKAGVITLATASVPIWLIVDGGWGEAELKEVDLNTCLAEINTTKKSIATKY